ncbi:hypothetical protein M0M57_02535 [Flavobacterium azooxidireducens]|uniref:T9SS sorting signal type C domain-containing protein n=1 Tax=Flavobacterium azooxidireducens TaxID=1871076 RepID=A0ABY4KK09_9FLAO|nr:hypothetical protein [Flavobacterium azooxidireducens]UPQ79720.1 hypothetical protein M0M57_02535 [Flavobacterium azooxidireducens]
MRKENWGVFFPLLICRLIGIIILFFYNTIDSYAQCAAYTANIHCTTAAPTIVGSSITCSPPQNNAGRRNFLVTNMVAGNIYRVSNCGSGFDTQLTIFNAAGSASLAYNDDDGTGCTGISASLDFTPPATGDYRMQLNRFNCDTATNQTHGTITVTLLGVAPPGPVNDLCSNATSLPCGTSNLSGTTVGTTNIANVSGCTMSNYGVWYSFVGDGANTTISSYADFDHKMAIVSGSCGSFTNLSCNDDALSYDTETTTFPTVNGTTYYVYIAHYSSTSTITGTFTISRSCTTPCSPGGGTGTTTLGCPSVLSGGLGLDGADPIPMDCNSVSTCVELEATYLQLGNTTSYTVESIDYNIPYQFNCLQNPVSVNVDDIWSPVINLPFNFCFYGNTYNSCIMGSNGMISFNTAAAGGASGYEFNDNLPSTAGALFANTIYGVYHDIDPSIGGEVGWELITLNTGCRALVAGWSNVPMYNDNSIFYTGMIVLYEDTNIIEVYIEEKNLDSYDFFYSDAWNYGNAIVGIQNSTATQAVVAPGRNGLSPNWTTTNEAWRFVPSGPSITSLQWFEGSGTSGPMLGTTDVIEVCPTVTTTYTARVTYTLCSGTTITETDETIVTVIGDKTWNGSIDSDWNKNNNWTPIGIPNSSDCVLIPITPNDPIISGTNYNGLAGTLRILDDATLTVNSNNSITVTDWVNVQANGTFDIHDNSSLVQINNTTNIGNIIYRRDTDIRRLDYVYWSSPVAGFNVSNIPAPIAPGPIFTWNTTLANPNGGQGYWVGAAGSTMQPAVGYIMRGPNSFGNTPTTLNGSFIGVPNNGPITTPITRGSDTNTATHYGINGTEITNLSDNYNLIGNPYPSAIRASQFLFNNNTKIEGNVRLWTHGTLPAAITSPFYDTYAYNYTPNDYFIYNFTGASCCPAAGSDLFIGAGQGFFVQMIDGPPASDVVTFNNGLRNSGYDNSLFYRYSNDIETETSLTDLERHRMWFDIINSDGLNDRTLVGYIENASMGRDSFFDANTAVAGNMIIYSLLNEEKLTIQGRSLPFDVNDIVPIGVHIPNSGQHTIALAAIDGLFENQAIYLKDNLLNSIHDIKENPYSFTSEQGTYNNRFEVIYQNETLGNPDFSFENIVRVTSNENVTVHSTIELMESILVYNVLGQKLAEYNNVNANQLVLTNLQKNNSNLLLKIKLQNGTTSIEKVIY